MKFIFRLIFLLTLISCSVSPKYSTPSRKFQRKKRYYNNYSHMTNPKKNYPQETRKEFMANCSYYADKFVGRKTANGEIYNHEDFTCAHKSLPFGTVLDVIDEETGEKVRVRVNDRGPFIKNRDLDLSKGAARKIGLVKYGVHPYRVKVIKR